MDLLDPHIVRPPAASRHMAAQPLDDFCQPHVVAISPSQQDNEDRPPVPAPLTAQQQSGPRPVTQPGVHRVGLPGPLAVVHGHSSTALAVAVHFMFQ